MATRGHPRLSGGGGEPDGRSAAAIRAIASGDADALSDAFCGSGQAELAQLLRSRFNQPVVLRRASSLGAVELRRPTLLALAVARDDRRSVEFLASHGIALDERLAVCDSASAELEYEAPLLLIAIMTGRLEAAQVLVTSGASIDATSSGGDSALMEACFEGCSDAAEFLVKSGANVNGCNAKNINGLMLAAYAGRAEVMELLLRHGANAAATDKNGRDAIFYSVTGGQLATLKLLVQHGLRPTADNRGTTVLMEAAASGKLDCLRYLISNLSALALDLHSMDSLGRNAPYHAAESGCLDTLRLLLDSGAVLQPDSRGRTAFMCACLKGDTPLVHYLLDYYRTFKLNAGAELDREGRSCLYYAATSGSTELLQRLLGSPSGEAGGSLDRINFSGSRDGSGNCAVAVPIACSRSGVTLLMQAAGKGKLSVVRYIAQRLDALGIEINASDGDGWTALAYAAALSSADVARLLVARGALCTAKTKDGKTVLMQAAQAGDEDLVAFLCEKAASTGLDVHACDALGWNALYYAMLSQRLSVFRRLLAHGLQCCAQPPSGVTLLMEGVDRGADDVVRFLIEAGDRLGVRLDASDSHGCNALFYCAASGDVDTFRLLVTRGTPLVADSDGRTVLMQAAYNGHVEMTAYLMENDVALALDVNAKDKDGRNALFYCVEGGHLDLLLMLLDYGIPMQADCGGKNNLFQAVAAGHWSIVDYIVSHQLQLGFDLAAVDQDGMDAMSYYVRRPTDSRIFQKLVASGLKVKDDEKNSNLLLVLSHALRAGDAAIVRRVLCSNHRCDVTFRRSLVAVRCNRTGETLFHWAARQNDVALFEHLADVYRPETNLAVSSCKEVACRTPLMLACSQKECDVNTRLITLMLKASKVDVNAVDTNGFDALRYALTKSNKAAVCLLLQTGALVCCSSVGSHKRKYRRPSLNSESVPDPPDAFMLAGLGTSASVAQMLVDATLTADVYNTEFLRGRDKFGRTALHYACMAGNAEIASIYLRVAPHLKDETDKSGSTPLMVAASWGHAQTVVNLLYYGADPNKADSTFRTALHIAVDCHNPSLTTIHSLCRHGKQGADVDARDAAGTTPLMIAAGHGNINVVKDLLDCGANPIACDYRGTEVVEYCKRGDYRAKTIIKKYCEMPHWQWLCLEAKQGEYKEVVDVTRILHMLQKGHVVTPQLEAIVLADPSYGGRVERLLSLLQQRGRLAFEVFCQALKAYYPVLGYELVALSYMAAHLDEAPT